METVEGKVSEIMKFICEEIYIPLDFRNKVREKLTESLKDHNKITRHASADSIDRHSERQ